MFKNFFDERINNKKDKDLNNIMFKQLIIESFKDNEIEFDKIMISFKNNNISLFDEFTINPDYKATLYQDDFSNSVAIEKQEFSEYESFLAAAPRFIKNEKYLIKIVENMDIQTKADNKEQMVEFVIELFNNNHKKTVAKIIEKGIFSKKELKLELILYSKSNSKMSNAFTHEGDFISDNIEEIKISRKTYAKAFQIYNYVLLNSNITQYKKIKESIIQKVNLGDIENNLKSRFMILFLEFDIIQPNQMIGEKIISVNPKVLAEKYVFGMHTLKSIAITKEKNMTIIKNNNPDVIEKISFDTLKSESSINIKNKMK